MGGITPGCESLFGLSVQCPFGHRNREVKGRENLVVQRKLLPQLYDLRKEPGKYVNKSLNTLCDLPEGPVVCPFESQLTHSRSSPKFTVTSFFTLNSFRNGQHPLSWRDEDHVRLTSGLVRRDCRLAVHVTRTTETDTITL